MHRLRWRLCKELKVAVDDKFFDNINNTQLLWYQIQMGLDDKENYELLRDVAEHNAMFWNPDGVEQIREARKNTYKTSNEDFEKSISELFGRELPSQDASSESLEDMLRQNSESEKTNSYLNMNLDEVNFIPIGGK